MYLLIHTPTHLGRPVQLGFVEKAAWSTALFKNFTADVERNRQAGPHYKAYLSKRDIERWGFNPPCGARVEVVEVEVPAWQMELLRPQPQPKPEMK